MKRSIIYLLLAFGILFLSYCKKDDIRKDEITVATPLIDFGSAKYRGYDGGLYPDGSNQRPAAHNAAGVAIAQGIKPLNSSGSVDEPPGCFSSFSLPMKQQYHGS